MRASVAIIVISALIGAEAAAIHPAAVLRPVPRYVHNLPIFLSLPPNIFRSIYGRPSKQIKTAQTDQRHPATHRNPDGLSDLVGAALDLAGTVTGAAGDLAGGALDAATGVVDGVVGGAGGAVGDLTGAVGGAAGGATDAVAGALSGAGKALQGGTPAKGATKVVAAAPAAAETEEEEEDE